MPLWQPLTDGPRAWQSMHRAGHPLRSSARSRRISSPNPVFVSMILTACSAMNFMASSRLLNVSGVTRTRLRSVTSRQISYFGSSREPTSRTLWLRATAAIGIIFSAASADGRSRAMARPPYFSFWPISTSDQRPVPAFVARSICSMGMNRRIHAGRGSASTFGRGRRGPTLTAMSLRAPPIFSPRSSMVSEDLRLAMMTGSPCFQFTTVLVALAIRAAPHAA